MLDRWFTVVPTVLTFLLAVAAKPLSRDDVSQCSINCVVNTGFSDGCVDFTDLQCICTNGVFLQGTLACIQQECTPADVAEALSLYSDECGSSATLLTSATQVGMSHSSTEALESASVLPGPPPVISDPDTNRHTIAATAQASSRHAPPTTSSLSSTRRSTSVPEPSSTGWAVVSSSISTLPASSSSTNQSSQTIITPTRSVLVATTITFATTDVDEGATTDTPDTIRETTSSLRATTTAGRASNAAPKINLDVNRAFRGMGLCCLGMLIGIALIS
ncbi:hypothetical protein PYCCODRAFT_1201742 [Trametes coccinea BRFM310]|uniref:CFEM domain-containing protein n=1 Tax=Trametes coccinea (strain BRFM310) TaxID=1353009 RepID=A0A1Y2I8J0_TRAC3|nr:hypothetical protein PYCCODRAFT_1201742 [Trametes coccinea BRFM310]